MPSSDGPGGDKPVSPPRSPQSFDTRRPDPTMAWLQFAVTVEQASAEQWADALLDAGAASVQAEDEDADSLDEQPIFGEPGEPASPFGWKRTRLSVLVDPVRLPDGDPAPLLAEAAGALQLASPRAGPVERLEDQDWVSATQAQYTPIPIGRRLLVTPSWEVDRKTAADAGRLALVVDPGLAFGTGSHPTTRLCLEWLDSTLGGNIDDGPGSVPLPPSVIDYGCGSGILAIGAGLLGAGDLRATDIDPQAVASTRHNAERNGVALLAGLPDEIELPPADIVLANILSNPLKLLAPMLSSLVAPGGTLVLSGVLERQVDEVRAVYAGRIDLGCWRSLDGWACLVGTRPLS